MTSSPGLLNVTMSVSESHNDNELLRAQPGCAGPENIFSDCGPNIFTGSAPLRARLSNRLVLESCLARPAKAEPDLTLSNSVKIRRIVALRSAQSLAKISSVQNISKDARLNQINVGTPASRDIQYRLFGVLCLCTLYCEKQNHTQEGLRIYS